MEKMVRLYIFGVSTMIMVLKLKTLCILKLIKRPNQKPIPILNFEFNEITLMRGYFALMT
jgi:hypothetical protein